MEDRQWFDVLLWPFAAVAGGVMFLWGKRYLETGPRGRVLNRFVFLTSVVVVFLGGFFDHAPAQAKTPGDTLAADDTVGAPPPAAFPAGTGVQNLLTNLAARADDATPCATARYEALAKEVWSASRRPDLGFESTLPAGFIEYVRRQLDLELSRIKRDDGQGGLTAAVESTHFADALRQHAIVVRNLDEQGVADRAITRFVDAALARTFTRIAAVPLAARLEATGLSREQYKALVAEAIDATFVLCRHYAATAPDDSDTTGVPTHPDVSLEYGVRPQDRLEPPVAHNKYGVRELPPPIEPPKPVPAYGVREMPDPDQQQGGRLTPVAQKRANLGDVSAIKGMVMMRQAGGAWVQLTTGNTVYLSTMLDNTQGPADVAFGRSRTVSLSAHELVTGWELQARTGITLPANY